MGNIRKKKDLALIDEIKIKKILIEFSEYKTKQLIAKKKEFTNKLEKRENSRLEKDIENIKDYICNLAEQIVEAKKEWKY